MNQTLSNKTAIVAGGGSGIGKSIALFLAEAGCHVLVAGRREEKLQEVANEFSGDPAISTAVCDVADRESVANLYKVAADTLGQVDMLVNCAGVNVPNRSMESLSPEDWDYLMQVNATGAFNLMYGVLPQMRERKDGLIININSIAGLRAVLLGGVAYNASKFAMTALSVSVAQEVKDLGIRVTNIYPGEVETPILDKRPVPVSAEHRARILQPDDVAAAVLMVAELPPRAHVPDLVIKPTTAAFA